MLAHLLLARRTPFCFLEVLLHRRHCGLSRWRLVQSPPLRDPERTNTARTATSVARGKTFTCQSCTLRKVMWRCYLSRPVEVHGRCDPCLHEDPGQVD